MSPGGIWTRDPHQGLENLKKSGSVDRSAMTLLLIFHFILLHLSNAEQLLLFAKTFKKRIKNIKNNIKFIWNYGLHVYGLYLILPNSMGALSIFHKILRKDVIQRTAFQWFDSNGLYASLFNSSLLCLEKRLSRIYNHFWNI